MPNGTIQIVNSMNLVGRVVLSNKQILRDISLGLYLGAKTPALHRTHIVPTLFQELGACVCALGLNGAGKSILLRIMVSVDKDYIGEISQSKGYTVGLLEQEPKLDASKTMIEVVKEAVQPIVEMPARFDEVNSLVAVQAK